MCVYDYTANKAALKKQKKNLNPSIMFAFYSLSLTTEPKQQHHG